MRAITIAVFLAGCGSLSVQPDEPTVAARTYFDHFAEPVMAIKCTSNACHANGEHVFTLDYAQLSQQLDASFASTSQQLLLQPGDLLHTGLYNADAYAVIQHWLQLEATARGL